MTDGRLGEDVVARDVIGRAVVPDLDRDVVATEGGDEPFEFTLGGAWTLVHQCARHRALATAAQHEPLARALATSSRVKRGAPFSPRRRWASPSIVESAR